MKKEKTVLIVKDHRLFLCRDYDGRFLNRQGSLSRPPRWSTLLLQEVSRRFEQVVVLVDEHFYDIDTHPEKYLWDMKINLQLQNFRILDFSSKDRLKAIHVWKGCIADVGGHVRKIKNWNNLNCYDIPRLTKGPHIQWVDAMGTADICPEVSKIKSFMQLAKQRELRAKW